MDDDQNRDKTIDEKKLSDALEKTSLEKRRMEGEPSAEEENKEKTGETADEKAEKEDKEEEVFKQEQYAVNQNDHEQLWNDFFENNFDMYDFEDTNFNVNHNFQESEAVFEDYENTEETDYETYGYGYYGPFDDDDDYYY
ncbi:hypothetical protein TYRP_018044 [Tyrophagus putrescentiae]|nr:hypothetical protein TYRP_018044 [Tyrophagus putrescentiae]